MNDRRDLDSAFAELQRQLPSDFRPVRAFVPGRWLVVFLTLFIPLVALCLWRVFGWRADQDVLGTSGFLGLSAIELIAGLVLLTRGLREAVPARGSSLAGLALAGASAALIHAAIIWTTFTRSQVYPTVGREWEVALYCFVFEVLLAIPCVLFALWLGRRGLTSRPRRLGLLGGVGAGLAADAVWRLICPYSQPAHALGSHSSGLVATVVLGLMLAWGWEIVRARAQASA